MGRANNATVIWELLTLQGAANHDLKHLKEYMKDISEHTELLLAPATTTIRYEPLGVCGVFSAWNYPVLLALKPVIQCITTGNAVILKPSEIAPATSKVLHKFVERYLDQDFIRCIEGGVDTAVELNKSKLDLICFTGSTQVGKIVAQTAAKNLTPCILELGGKCPTVVHETADIDHTVEKLSCAKFLNCGQTCICPDYLFVHESIFDDFVARMIQCTKRLFGESATGSAEQGKMINDFHLKRVIKLIDTSGGKIVLGGKANSTVKHIEPTIILNPSKDS